MIDPRRSRQINQNRDMVMRNVGQPVIWRVASVLSTGTPEFGIENATTYKSTTIQALLTPAELEEVRVPGGIVIEGDMWATVREKPDRRDHYEWLGKIYEIHTEPSPVQMGNAIWYRVFIRRAGDIG